MQTIALIIASNFVLVFALGMQSRMVNREQYLGSFFTSYLIGFSQLGILKTVPASTSFWEQAAYINSGPFAIVFSIWVHHKFFNKKDKDGTQ